MTNTVADAMTAGAGTVTRRSVLAATAVLAGANRARGQPAGAQPLRSVTIGLSSASFGTAAAPLAKELGLFARHGLDPRLIVMETANAATTALVAGSLDFALSGPGELVAAQGRGLKVVVVANTYGGFSPTLVLAKAVADTLGASPASPVASRFRVLDGLLLATTSATSASTVAFRAVGAAQGATLRFTYMAQATMVAALGSGAVKGFLSSAPFWALPVTGGNGVVWISGPKGELPDEYTSKTSGNLQAMRGFCDANKGLVDQVRAVFDDLGVMIESRPDTVKLALAKLYPTLDAPTLNLLFASEAPLWRNRALTPADMEHEIALVRAGGVLLPQITSVDPASLLYP